MSSEFERFNEAFFGETATEQDKEILEKIALDLISHLPGEYVQELAIVNSDNQTAIKLSAMQQDDLDSTNPQVKIEIGKLNTYLNFSIIFDAENNILSAGYRTVEDITESKNIIQSHQDDNDLNEQLRCILASLFEILEFLEKNDTFIGSRLSAKSQLNMKKHIADTIRDTMTENSDLKYHFVECRVDEPVPKTFLTIEKKTVVGTDEIPEDEMLTIELLDNANELVHHYQKQSNKQACYTIYSDQDDRSLDDSLSVLPADFFEDLYSSNPTKTGVETLTAALLNASISEMLELQNEDSITLPHYPSLDFNFDVRAFFKDDTIDSSSTALEILRSLRETCEATLPLYYPEIPTPLPDYTARAGRHTRVEKFLKKKVTNLDQERRARNVILNVHDATELILKKLEAENNPISQILNQLSVEYGDLLDRGVLEEVTLFVIIQTQEKSLRELYNRHIAAWRIGNILHTSILQIYDDHA